MAIYHASVKVIGRSSGRSATAAAAYRAAEQIADGRSGEVHDYTRKRGVEHTEILTPAGAPAWTQDRAALWNAVEAAEKRADAQVCREVEVSLPRELTPEQRVELTRAYVRDQFTSRGMVADVSIHCPKAGDGQEQPHAHILLTMRELKADGFGNKAREWNAKPMLEGWREAWAHHANRALEAAGHAGRIDHRSLEAQGIDRLPTVHEGPAVTAMERRHELTEVGDLNAHIRQHNRLASELRQVGAKIIDLEAERARRQAEDLARRQADAQRQQEAEQRRQAEERALREAQQKTQQEAELQAQRLAIGRLAYQQYEAEQARQKAPAQPQTITIDLRPLPDQLRKQGYDLQVQSGSHRHTANMLDVPELLTEHDARRQLTASETRAVEIADAKWRQIQLANAAADKDRGFFGQLMATQEREQERQALEQAARERQEAQGRLLSKEQWLDTADGCKAVWGAQEARRQLRFGRQQARLDAAAEADRLRAQADRMGALSRDVGALVSASVTTLAVKPGHTMADLEAAVKARLEAPDVKERLAQQQRQTRSQGPRIR